MKDGETLVTRVYGEDAFRRDIIEGFSSSPKKTSPAGFYDRRGSELFDRITRLPEYYPTRAETAILKERGPEFLDACGPGRCIVEFGAGSLTKTPLLLRAIDPAAYVPVDISGSFLCERAAELSDDFPDIPIWPAEADFRQPINLPSDTACLSKLGFFPGSTIGNFEAAEAIALLRVMRETLGKDALLLIGMDRIKDLEILIPAYDDALGVTAAFNLNLLHRINRELAGNIPVNMFRHEARWNDKAARIEMHLRTTAPIDFRVAGRCFDMKAGETIHTENSHKYDSSSAALLLRAGGWEPLNEWRDSGEFFSLYLARSLS